MVEQIADEAAHNLGRSATGCVFEAGHNTRRGRCRSAMEAPIQRLVGTMERTSRIERRPHYRDLDVGLRERGPPRYAGVGFSVTARPKAKSAQDGAGNRPRHRHPPRRVIDNGNRFKTGPGQHRLPPCKGTRPRGPSRDGQRCDAELGCRCHSRKRRMSPCVRSNYATTLATACRFKSGRGLSIVCREGPNREQPREQPREQRERMGSNAHEQP